MEDFWRMFILVTSIFLIFENPGWGQNNTKPHILSKELVKCFHILRLSPVWHLNHKRWGKSWKHTATSFEIKIKTKQQFVLKSPIDRSFQSVTTCDSQVVASKPCLHPREWMSWSCNFIKVGFCPHTMYTIHTIPFIWKLCCKAALLLLLHSKCDVNVYS